jgi:exopolysaccharide biosynthesis polyprenyl glycosylphosphotransferase
MRHTDALKSHGKVTIAFDLIIIVLSGALAFLARPAVVIGSGRDPQTTIFYFAIPTIWFLTLSWQNAWVFTGHSNTSENYRRVLRAGLYTLLSVSSLSFVLKADFSRAFVLISTSIATLLLIIQRKISWDYFLRKAHREGVVARGLVIAGQDDGLFFRFRQEDFSEAELIKFDLAKVKGSMESHLTETIKSMQIDFIICEIEWLSSSEMITLFARVADKTECQLYLVDVLGAHAPRREVQLRGSNMYSRLSEPHLWHSKALFKRMLDVVFSSIALVVLSPVMLLIAIGIKLTSKGPVLYTDQRVGLQGSTFTFPKFRTMYEGAHKERKNVLGAADEGIGERYKNDKRITPFGKFLRRFSLDELPQFWSVLTGKMSLVGPRPILPEEIPQMSTHHEHRLIARPGLTGLWQVSGRKETTWDERMKMDLEYVQNWSPAMDTALILKTVGAIITGKGAY